MATLTQTLSSSPTRTASRSLLEFTKHWHNRFAYWNKEAVFILEIVDLHCDLKSFPVSCRKARYQMSQIVEEDIPALSIQIKELQSDQPSAGNGSSHEQILKRLVRLEQKFNLIKLVLLEVATDGIPLQFH